MAGVTIDELFIRLGMDISQFQRDLATATSETNRTVSQINRMLRLDRIRMNTDLSQFDNIGESVQGLSTKLAHLSTQEDHQRQYVDSLRSAQRQLAQQYGENSDIAQRMAQRLLQEQANYNRLQRDIRNTEEALRNLRRAQQEAQMNQQLNPLINQRDQQRHEIRLDVINSRDAERSIEQIHNRLNSLRGVEQTQIQIVQQMQNSYRQMASSQNVDSEALNRLMSRLRQEELELANIRGELRRTDLELRNFGNSTGHLGSSFRNAEMQAARSMTAMTSMVRQTMMAVAAYMSVQLAFNWLVKTNSQMEQFRVQMTVMLGSAEKAKAVMAELETIADKTPYTTKEVVAAATQLFSAGLTDYKKYLDMAGNWAAGAGAKLEDTTAVIARVSAGQFGEAFERARELGIGMVDLWSKGLQFDSGGQFIGTIDQAMTAMQSIVKEKFGGLNDIQSHTFQGLVSTAESDIQKLGEVLGKPIFTKIVEGLEWLTNTVQQFKKDGGFDTITEGMSKLFDDITTAFEPMEQAFKNFAQSGGFNDLALLAANAYQVLKSLIGVIGDVMLAMNPSAKPGESGLIKFLAFAQYNMAMTIERLTKYARVAWATIKLLTDIETVGPTKAWETYTNALDYASEHFEKRRAEILTTAKSDPLAELTKSFEAHKQAVVNGNKDMAESDKQREKERQQAAFTRMQAIKQQITYEKQIQDMELGLLKARRVNPLQVADRELSNAKRWLGMMEESESLAKGVQGPNYKPSKDYLDALTAVAEKQAALYELEIQRYEQLGYFIDATAKAEYEYELAVKQRGDTELKAYEKTKAAVKDYIDYLKMAQQQYVTQMTSGVKLDLGMKLDKNYIGDYLHEYELASDREAAITNQSKLTVIKANLEILNSHKLNAKEAVEIYKQTQSSLQELMATMESQMNSLAQKLQSTRTQLYSAYSSGVSMLSNYYSQIKDPNALSAARDFAQEYADIYKQAKESGTLTMEMVQQGMSINQTTAGMGLSRYVDVSTRDIVAVTRDNMAKARESIASIKKAMDSLKDQMSELGTTSAMLLVNSLTSTLQAQTNKIAKTLGLPSVNFATTANVNTAQAQGQINAAYNNFAAQNGDIGQRLSTSFAVDFQVNVTNLFNDFAEAAGRAGRAASDAFWGPMKHNLNAFIAQLQQINYPQLAVNGGTNAQSGNINMHISIENHGIFNAKDAAEQTVSKLLIELPRALGGDKLAI